MIVKIKNWFSTRYEQCDKLELEQSLIRIAIGTLIFAYLVYRYFRHDALTFNDNVAYAIVGVLLVLSIIVSSLILYDPKKSIVRRLFGAWIDMTCSSMFVMLTGEPGVLIVVVYLWVIFGNGFRFGNNYLFHAQGLALAGFISAAYMSPYWRQHEIIAYSVVLMLIALPIYIATLTTRLNEAKKKAEEASALKSRFVAVMSHEIRTPLNGIVGIGALLKATPLNHEQKDLLATMEGSSKLLLSLVNNVLDVSKIEENKLLLEHSPFDLRDPINDLLQAFTSVAEAKGLKMLHAVDIAENCYIGDRYKLQQVLTNLLGNAIKFTESGSVLLTVRSFGISGGNTKLRFEVVDSGIGIPKDKIDSVFESFTQADASTTRRFGGSGLGLTISKYIVEAMGGKLQCESQEQVGTRFWFDINMEVYQEDIAANTRKLIKSEVSELPTQQWREISVLICEDDATNQKVLQKLIELIGHRARLVQSADDMLDQLEQAQFDLVISDLNMAGMTGIDALKMYRFMRPDDKATRFILFTADASPETRQAANHAGFDAFLNKPVDANTLFTVIAQLFDMPIVTTNHLEDMANRVNLRQDSESSDTLDTTTLRELEFLGAQDTLFVHRLLKNYLLDADQLIEKIAKAIEQKEYVLAQEYCHALKGNSLSVGARKVWQTAEQIENAAPSVLRFRGAGLAGQLKVDLDAVQASIDSYLSRRQTATL
jgi:two-component system, sensor histidine kinase RpfC